MNYSIFTDILRPDEQQAKHNGLNASNLLHILNPKEQMLLNELLKFDIPLKRALLIIYVSGRDNIAQLLEFLTTDDNGYYNHPFCQDNLVSSLCLICDSVEDNHQRNLHYNLENGN